MSTQIPESWLSAFLDGELSDGRRVLLEKALKVHPQLMERLQELAKVRAAVHKLPIARASAAELDAINEELKKIAGRRAAVEIVLGAYLDRELTAAQGKSAEVHLLADPTNRAVMEQIRNIGEALRSLPPVSAPKAFSAELAGKLHADSAGQGKRPFSELLSAYLDGEAHPSLKVRVADKLRHCTKTKRLAADFQAVGRAVRRLEPVLAPPDTLRAVLAQLNRRSIEQEVRPASALSTVKRKGGGDRKRYYAFALALAASVAAFFVLPRFFAEPGSTSVVVVEPEKIEVRSPSTRTVAPPSIATAAVGNARPASVAAAPPIDEPEEDPPLPNASSPSVPGLTVDRSFEKLGEGVRAGQIIELDNSEITFLCVDVKQMYDRLQIVLVQSQLSPAAGKREERSEPLLTTVEVSATPEQLREVLAALRRAEEATRLVASVEVKRNTPSKLVASVQPTVPSLEVSPPHANVASTRPDENRSATARAKTLFPEANAAARKAVVQTPGPASPPERLQVRFVLRESKGRPASRVQ